MRRVALLGHHPSSEGDAPVWRGIISETSFRLAGRAVGGVLSIYALHVILNYLGTTRWAVISAATAWTGIFAILGEFGVSTSAARDLVGAGERASRILGSTYVFGLVGAATAAVVAFVAGQGVYAEHPAIRHLILLMLPSFPFAVIWVIAGTLLAANRRSDLRGVLDVLSSALLVAVSLVVVHEHEGIDWYVLGSVVAIAATAILGVVLLRRLPYPTPSFIQIREALVQRARATRPIGIVVVAVLLYRYVDTVLLSLLSPTREVGVYAVAYQLTGFVMTIPAFILGTSVTRFTEAATEQRQRLMAYLVNALSGPILPLAAVLAVMAGPILRLIAGQTGGPATVPFILLLVATVLLWIAAPFTAALIWSGNEKAAARITYAAFATNFILNVVLDRAFGADGASIAMIVSELLSAGLAGTIYCRRSGFRPSLTAPLLGAGSAALIVGVWALTTTG